MRMKTLLLDLDKYVNTLGSNRVEVLKCNTNTEICAMYFLLFKVRMQAVGRT